MPFIGTQPDVGGYSVLDNLTASATASYTLQKDSANFSPSSANQLLVSLNGVIQKPGSSFTVSGSTLTFSSALTSSDSIDFILAMGEPLLIGTPSAGSVNTTQLATSAVTNAKLAGSITDAKLSSPGVVKQIQETILTTQPSYNNFVYNDVMSVNITPSSTSSKILIFVNFNFGGASNSYISTKVLRDSTFINQPGQTGVGEETHFGTKITDEFTTFNQSGQFLDSPSTTSQVTYKVQASPKRSGTGNYITVNRSYTLGDDNQFRTVSSITVMEIVV